MQPRSSVLTVARSRSPRERRRSSGFTLIELMVVLVLAGIIVSMVAMNAMPNAERDLRTDADRLAQLMQLAREEAQVRGATVRFQTDGLEYRFLQIRNNQWRVIDDDGDLRPRRWPGETRISVERPDGLQMIEFGRDMVEPPYRIVMQRSGVTMRINANGLGSFEVEQQS